MTALLETVVRPAAVLPAQAAVRILAALHHDDVSTGGVWNATTIMWQRWDRPWDSPDGLHGTARLVGTIAVLYDAPRRDEITIVRVQLTGDGVAARWTLEGLCDDVLVHAGLTLTGCPRVELATPPRPDPFRRSRNPGVTLDLDRLTAGRAPSGLLPTQRQSG